MVRLNEVELLKPDLPSSLDLYRDAEGEPVHYHATWGAGPDFLLFSVYAVSSEHETRTSLGFEVTGLDEPTLASSMPGFAWCRTSRRGPGASGPLCIPMRAAIASGSPRASSASHEPAGL